MIVLQFYCVQSQEIGLHVHTNNEIFAYNTTALRNAATTGAS